FQRLPFLQQVGPQVTHCSNALGHRSQRERLWPNLSSFDFFPRAGRRHGRAGLRTHGVSRSVSRAVTIATGIDENAASAIDFMELLRQMVWIAAYENSSDRMAEPGHLAKVRLTIKRNSNVKSFRARSLDPARQT